MDFIYSLRAHPNTPGDYTNKDRSLRVRQVKVVGDFAVTYWFDAPVNIVMVVEVQPADR
jgi:hypothetical protein